MILKSAVTVYSSFRVNHVREKKFAKKRGSKFEYWDKTSWLNFTIESNFRPWIISKLLRSWKQAFFIIVWPINVCFMVIVNWLLKISLSTREIELRFYYYFFFFLFQTAYYISKLIPSQDCAKFIHFSKILFSSVYLDGLETP